jgi:hypothetical protein
MSKFYFKGKVILFCIVLLCLSHLNIVAQVIRLVPNVGGIVANQGYYADPIVYNNLLYFQYVNSAGVYQLGKYDGISITLIPNPDSSKTGYEGNNIIYNNKLYFQYTNTKGVSQLGQYDGTSIKLIPNPDSSTVGYDGTNYQDTAYILYGNKLYFQYTNVIGINQLAQYDGNKITLIPNLNSTDPGYNGWPIIYNGILYFQYLTGLGGQELAQFDGTTMTSRGADFEGWPIVYGNKLFFPSASKIPMVGIQLMMDNGTVDSIISPDKSFGAFQYPVIYNDDLYYMSGIGNLAQYNGDSISVIQNPTNSGGLTISETPIVYNGKLYLKYLDVTPTNPEYYLVQFDGITFHSVAGSSSFDSLNYLQNGYPDNFIVSNNKLYFQSYTSNGDQLGQYDGSKTNIIKNPDGSQYGYQGFPIIYNNKLYFFYYNVSGVYQLGYLDPSTIINCPNTTTSFVGVTSASGNTYQWQVNIGSGFKNIDNSTLYSGVTTDTLLLVGAPSSLYGYQYRCTVTNDSVTYSPTYTLQFGDTWTGAIDSVWENSANWSCGSIPDANTDVFINSGTPKVILGSNTTIRSLTVSPNASFTIQAPYSLTVIH